MYPTDKFYIGGTWVDPVSPRFADVINPATEETVAKVALGSAADVDRAVAAAKTAFATYSLTTRDERIAVLKRVHASLMARFDDLADAMTTDMGAPATFARNYQAQSGVDHIAAMIEVLERFVFEETHGATIITREAIGVCGLITPWNWPINQIVCKVAPALAAGCTMVLKPSEIAPLSALVFAECLHDSGVPAGVFNLVNGDGPGVGVALASHPGIDMVSFTGSTRAGIAVAKNAAETVKRVAQELGGNSPNIVLDDADLETAVATGVSIVMSNSGQSCDSPARMLVPHGKMDAAIEIARRTAEALKVGDPRDEATDLGPLVSAAHYAKVQALIEAGMQSGAKVVTGGTGRPEGTNRGYFARPTVFARVTRDMPTFRNEVFGPVISLIGYSDIEEAIDLANDTEYGLAGRVQSSNPDRARAVARRIRAGWVEINSPTFNYHAPFGGYKQSGNGREYGEWGLHDYLEVKAMLGAG